MSNQVIQIKGQFVREDGSTSDFVLHLDGTSSWHQWGATEKHLYETMPHLEAMEEALFEANLITLPDDDAWIV